MLTVFWDIPRVSGRADVRLGLHDLVDNVGRRHQERVSEKRNENKTKNAQGAVLMAGASRIWKFVKPNLLRVYDVDLLGLFLRFFTTSFELRAVDRSAFCHISPRPSPPAPQSPSNNLRRHRSLSRRPARGCVSYFLCPA